MEIFMTVVAVILAIAVICALVVVVLCFSIGVIAAIFNCPHGDVLNTSAKEDKPWYK